MTTKHTPHLQEQTNHCHQSIKHRAALTIQLAVQQPDTEGAPPFPLVALLCCCVALVFSDRFPEESALRQCLRDTETSPLELVAVLQPVARAHPLTLDQVFVGLLKLTPFDCIPKLGPLCWAVVGGEAFLRPLLESLGVERISDIDLIRAVLDGCLSALGVETETLSDITRS